MKRVEGLVERKFPQLGLGLRLYLREEKAPVPGKSG
jgi:hypothetical protein